MRRVLVIFLSVLCIALPLRADAKAAKSCAHCPPAQHMSTVPDTGSTHPLDCCEDAMNTAKAGQLCKMGQNCSPSLTYVLPPAPFQFAVATAAAQLPTVSPPVLTGSPHTVWRPPARS
jgi:hypothetical protein